MSKNYKKRFYCSIIFFIIALLIMYTGIIVFQYEKAIKYIDDDNYNSAKNMLAIVPNQYKDCEGLKTYINYYLLYQETEEYVEDSVNEISKIELKYNIEYREKVDELITIAKDRKEVERLNQERILQEEFGGELPYDGMDVSDLRYTSLGAEDKKIVNQSWWHDNYIWYTDEGETLATCTAEGSRVDNFTYYGTEYGYDEKGGFVGADEDGTDTTIVDDATIKNELEDRLPYDGLSFEYLKYTVLGVPDGSDKMEGDITVYYWESESGNKIAICTNNSGQVDNFMYKE